MRFEFQDVLCIRVIWQADTGSVHAAAEVTAWCAVGELLSGGWIYWMNCHAGDALQHVDKRCFFTLPTVKQAQHARLEYLSFAPAKRVPVGTGARVSDGAGPKVCAVRFCWFWRFDDCNGFEWLFHFLLLMM